MWYFLWAIQTFSCGGSFARAFSKCEPNVSVRRIEASFRKRNFSKSTLASLTVVLGTYTCPHDYWHCVITPGLQVSWHEFVCMARSVLVSTVRRLVRRCWRLLCSRFHLSSWVSSWSYVCCGVVAIRCCLLCFVGAGPVWKDACMDWARAYLRNAPVQAPGPELDQAEA